MMTARANHLERVAGMTKPVAAVGIDGTGIEVEMED
jgi:hypothetical protein